MAKIHHRLKGRKRWDRFHAVTKTLMTGVAVRERQPHTTPVRNTMASTRYYAVYQLNGQIAVLADDEGKSVALPVSRLPKGVKKGSVLSIHLDNAGTPSWSTAEIDEDEAKRRADEAERLDK